MTIREHIDRRRVIVCAGSGGVGKTTVATALSSLTSLVAANSSLVAAGISVTQATSGSALQFTSKRGENFEVASVNDVTNVLGLGTAQNASGTDVGARLAR